jgi:hypothetical protein
MVGYGIDTHKWPERGDFYHVTGGHAYGPSLPGERLGQYQDRVRDAYGSLRGVSFHSFAR